MFENRPIEKRSEKKTTLFRTSITSQKNLNFKFGFNFSNIYATRNIL
jgi:hypothetical protein